MSHSVEDIKAASHRLRGSLLDSLAAARTSALAAGGVGAMAAQNGGYQWAFAAGALFAVLAAVLGATLLRADLKASGKAPAGAH